MRRLDSARAIRQPKAFRSCTFSTATRDFTNYSLPLRQEPLNKPGVEVPRAKIGVGENSSVPYKGNIVAVYFIIVMMCELMAIGVSLKYLAVIFGFSDSI